MIEKTRERQYTEQIMTENFSEFSNWLANPCDIEIGIWSQVSSIRNTSLSICKSLATRCLSPIHNAQNAAKFYEYYNMLPIKQPTGNDGFLFFKITFCTTFFPLYILFACIHLFLGIFCYCRFCLKKK